MRNLVTYTVAAVLTASTLTVTIPAASAASTGGSSAAACTNPPKSYAEPGYGYAVSGRTSALRVGPNAACAIRKNIPPNAYFEIDCTHWNGSNWWYHGTAHGQGGPWNGWLYSGNLADRYDYTGHRCPNGLLPPS